MLRDNRFDASAYRASIRKNGAMTMHTMNKALSSVVGVLSAIMLMPTLAPPATAQSTSAEEAQVIAQEAYVYLYPLILMDLTRKQLINLDPKVNPMGGPANAFAHTRAFPTADMR